MVQQAFQVFFYWSLTFSLTFIYFLSSHTCKIGFLCVCFLGTFGIVVELLLAWNLICEWCSVYPLKSWVGQLKGLFFVWTFVSFFIFTVNHNNFLSDIQISNRYTGFLFVASVHSVLLNLLFALFSTRL